MRKVLFFDMKRAFSFPVFLISVLMVFVAGIVGAGDAIDYIHAGGIVGQGPNYIMLAREGIRGEEVFLVTPIACVLPFAAAFVEEFRTRFYLYSLSRAGWRRFFLGKVLVTFFSGGVCVCAGAVLLTITFKVWFSSGDAALASSFGDTLPEFLSYLQVVGIASLNGGFWALIGALCAVVMRSCHMAYASPFILCYVLTSFQERYYAQLYFLSPKEWTVGGHLTLSIRCAILVLFSLFIGFLYMRMMRRRVRHE